TPRCCPPLARPRGPATLFRARHCPRVEQSASTRRCPLPARPGNCRSRKASSRRWHPPGDRPLILALFLTISCLGILMALGTVLARHRVHAALFLVGFFFIVACQFVLLEAEFLAAVQVLIYIGAVAILLLFGIMLTRNIQGDETTTGRWPARVPAAVIGL